MTWTKHSNGGGDVESGAWVESGAVVASGARVASGAWVASGSRAIVCGPIGSRSARLTAYWCVTPDGEGVEFVTGCFLGTGEALIAASEETHGVDHPHTRDYAEAVALMTRLVMASLSAETRARAEAEVDTAERAK